jgi:hypothetical protein
MSIKEYISQKFASLGLVLNEADLVDMGLFNSSENVTESTIESVQTSFVLFIPSLLIRPTSVSEGGVSISRSQKQDIEAYYSLECKRLGLRNELAPRVKFL